MQCTYYVYYTCVPVYAHCPYSILGETCLRQSGGALFHDRDERRDENGKRERLPREQVDKHVTSYPAIS